MVHVANQDTDVLLISPEVPCVLEIQAAKLQGNIVLGPPYFYLYS